MTLTDHTSGVGSGSEVTVRTAGEADARTLARLGALDSASMPVGPTLVAEIDGEAVAALPIAGGAPVADPFRPTAAAIELLELRAVQIGGRPRTSARSRSYRERLRSLIRSTRALPHR